MRLWYHPLSPYSRKVLVALYEKGLAFDRKVVPMPPNDAVEKSELACHPFNPGGLTPVLELESGRYLPESTIIVEYLDQLGVGLRLLPSDPAEALEARLLDRFGDLHLIAPARYLVWEGRRPPAEQNGGRLAASTTALGKALHAFDAYLGDRPFVLGDALTLADLAPAAAMAGLWQIGFSLEPWPRAARWFDAIRHRASWQAILEESAGHAHPRQSQKLTSNTP